MSIPWEVVEPRCHVCQDPLLRWRVNELLDWVGAPLRREGRQRWVTIADIQRDLNQAGHQVTYASLWVHARRHHSAEAVMAKMARIMEETYREFE